MFGCLFESIVVALFQDGQGFCNGLQGFLIGPPGDERTGLPSLLDG